MAASSRPQVSLGLTGPKVRTAAPIGGSSEASLSVGISPFSGNVGASPRLRIGNSRRAAQGSSYGGTLGGAIGSSAGPVGAVVGSFGGSAAGSIAGGISDKAFGGGTDAKETDQREGFYDNLRESGLVDENWTVSNPDGSTFTFDDGGSHSWKSPDRRVDGIGDRNLYSYEIDYTNDMDYVAGMAGVSLSRMTGGGANKPIDQAGNALGNSFLGKVGYGNELTQQNFDSVMTNARASYAKKGIKSKEDMLTVANQMYSEGRINDFDYGVMQQTAGMVFDGNFGMAQQLMGGRWDGIKTAGKGQAGARQNRPGRIYSPVLSPEEAQLSVQPFFDSYRKRFPVPKQSKGGNKLAQGLGLIGAFGGAFSLANNASGGVIGETIKDGAKDFAEYIGLTDAPEVPEITDGSIYEGVGGDYSLEF